VALLVLQIVLDLFGWREPGALRALLAEAELPEIGEDAKAAHCPGHADSSKREASIFDCSGAGRR